MKRKKPSVSQTMTNSPGGIQAGRDVTINQAPQDRHLTTQQRAQLVALLQQQPKAFVDIVWTGDGEAAAFALELNAAIKEAGWTTNDLAQGFFSGGAMRGVTISGNDPAPAAANTMYHVLIAIGLRVNLNGDSGKAAGAWSLVIGSKP